MFGAKRSRELTTRHGRRQRVGKELSTERYIHHFDQSVVGAGKPTHNSYSFAPIRQADVADEVGKGKAGGARSRYVEA